MIGIIIKQSFLLVSPGFNSYGFFAMVLAGMNIAAIINSNNNNNNHNNQNNNIQGVQEANSVSGLSSMNTASVRRKKRMAAVATSNSLGGGYNNTNDMLSMATNACSLHRFLCKLNTLVITDLRQALFLRALFLTQKANVHLF